MKCPRCNRGVLNLYKATEKVYWIPITKRCTLSKKDIVTHEHNTIINYLECNNRKCMEVFKYKEKNGMVEIVEDITELLSG